MQIKVIDAQRAADEKRYDEALEMLHEILQNETENVEALLTRGRIFYQQQQWGNASNDFATILEIDPLNKEATTQLAMTKNILNYFNPEMFNP